MKKTIIITLTLILLCAIKPSYCAESETFNLTGLIESFMNYQDKDNIKESQISAKEEFLNATNNIYNGNVVVARDEFSKTIDLLDNDVSLLMFAKKLYNYGFFTLGDKALSKISNRHNIQFQVKNLKEAYELSYKLSEENENYLIKAYTSIFYNNSPEEVAFNLIKKTNLMENSDYANYIMAISMNECKQYNQALIYINRAIEKNNKNSNYKYLKAKTLFLGKKYKEALKYINESENKISIYFDNDIKILKQQVLSNLASNDFDKKFYQIYAYYLDGNYYKVLNETQNILNFYKNNPKILTLQGMAHLALGENDLAENDFNLSYKQNKKFNLTQMGLADCSFINEDYKDAYNKYKKLINSEFKNEAVIKSYISLEKTNKNDKKLLKLQKQKETIDKKAYYEYYRISNDIIKDEQSKKRTVGKSLSINILNKDTWDVLFDVDYKNSNYENIEKIASVLLFSDDMNAEYYYYQALSLNHKNNKKEAFYELKKAVNINPEYKPAIELMNKLQNELI